MNADDDAALTAYTAQFRGDTVEETALAEYEGKRYRRRIGSPLEIFTIDEEYHDPLGWLRLVSFERKTTYAMPDELEEVSAWE